ncbi:Npun_F5749 family FMN-dependent PPOX-type flavoprotein [Phormidium sp. CCY1219]|uniref:Npun_F5749 family FMN-dependent PPOX-type flavoprotein n=1 Tax=Phormidium sp. CCY1219 TaxID=2886104 RepID=UPI002D1ECAB1|nr:Npun_F5749 family FMN-dependent PPOX-type flavoprotein [Phormidium sp. CCY1219]MEB3828689.1 pyridoxamine 5'-phosphate oxidase family protein [Phormidium sp. CCY1219]
MSLAPWRSPLSRALHRNRARADAKYFQLATIRRDRSPANRTVVFRGFLQDSDRLKIVTDGRSEKIEQIDFNPQAEACWYFPITREQYRLQGTLTSVKSDAETPELQQARHIAWQDLSPSARLQFAWPAPGQPRHPNADFDPPAPDPVQPTDPFCLLLLDPIRVECLELRGNPQNRWLYLRQSDRSWSVQEINP